MLDLLQIPVSRLIIFRYAVGLLFAVGLTVDIALLVRLITHPVRRSTSPDTLRSMPWSWCYAAALVAVIVGARAGLPFHILAMITMLVVVRRGQVNRRGRALPGMRHVAGFAWRGLILAVGLWPVAMLAAYASYALCYHAGVDITSNPMVNALRTRQVSWQFMLYLGMLAVLIGPLAEELFFRWFAMRLLSGKLGGFLGILLSSLLFASLHPIQDWPPIFILSLGISAAYALTGSVIVPVIAHSVFNLVSVVLLMLLRL
ncbi:MAG: CPBP family intramembrane metalloprotease [Lentisphaerales bacterium]|nr:MAG: CPBP family intramembrane metalloprotease [Lentisphaerales bacterium]